MPLVAGALKVLVVYAILVAVSYKRWHDLPQPVSEEGDPKQFSEGRANVHIRHLADEIGGRQVGTNGVREAAKYLLEELEAIKKLGEETRDDLVVEIQLQETSGSYHLDLFLTPMYLTYSGLENLILKISPKAAPLNASSLLVNAHFDSAIASPGAADCAACTAIAVETARTIVADKSLEIKTPVVFLLNGGEETYMNAAHGFATQHEWAAKVSHFINIESTGSYGPDVVFRSNSDLLISAYLSASVRPRANVVFQDIFDLGIMPAETDYAVFAHESLAAGQEASPGTKDEKLVKSTKYGDLPGIDIATMFDSRSYHTALDISERIPEGCTQNFGDNILALVLKSSEMLAEHQEEQGRGGSEKDDTSKNVGQVDWDWVYFDVMGMFVIAFPFQFARVIHCLPLGLTLLAMFLLEYTGRGQQKGKSILSSTLAGILTFVGSWICAMLCPILLFGMTAMFVQPMAWYGRPYIAGLLLVPAAVVGVSLPYLYAYSRASTLESIRLKQSGKLQEVLIGHVLGSCLILSTLGAYMTLNQTGAMKHSGYMFVFWVISSLIALCTKVFYFAKAKGNGKGKRTAAGINSFDTFDVLDTLVIHLPALVVCVHIFTFGFLFFLERISTMGSSMDWHGRAHADMIIGVICGFFFFLAFGPLVPFLSYHVACSVSRKSKKNSAKSQMKTNSFVGVSILTCFSLVCLAVILIQLQDHRNSFSSHNPKRVFVQHLHVLRSDLQAVEESSFTLLGVDSVPLGNVLPDELRECSSAPSPMEHLLAAYPITRFMKDSASLKAESCAQDDVKVGQSELPSLSFHSEYSEETSTRRCHITMRSPFASYFGVNVIGKQVSRFSFTSNDTEPLIASEMLEGESFSSPVPLYGIRHVANVLDDQSAYEWSWWMDIESEDNASTSEDDGVKIAWTASNITETPYLQRMVGKLPDYVNPIPITTFMHQFHC